MSKHELTDNDGKVYLLQAGAGPKWPDRSSLATCSISAGQLLERFDYSQFIKAIPTLISHLSSQAALASPHPLPVGASGMRLVAACPKQAINDGLSSSNLVIHQLGTTEVETVDGDNRAMLRVKIQQGLAEIIAAEKLETANLDAVFQQENTATKGLIVAGAGLTGLGNAAWGLLSWAKEASDLVNPVVRGWNHYQAAKSALNSDNFAANYADNALKAEKRELVEAMGFDPSAITMEQLDSAMEVADLIWSDSALQSKLTQFCKDYIAAQHLTEQAEMLGGAVFEILLTIILAAVTGGAAAVASLGSKARHMTKFRKVGDLLMEFAEASKKAKNTNKSKGVKANKGKSASFSDFEDAGEILVQPFNPPPKNQPASKAQPTPESTNTPATNPAKVRALISKSPTLSNNLQQLSQQGWKIQHGPEGQGSSCNTQTKVITIDSSLQSNPQAYTQTLAHESGHALYIRDPYTPETGLTRQEYIDANVNSLLKDEGEATLMNAQVRHEILINGGDEIGIAGANANAYNNAYNDYLAHGDRDKARQEIGNIFADNERPSTEPDKTYKEYYSQTYEDHWDNVINP